MAAKSSAAATVVNITPDVSLLKKSGEVNYRIPDALAELADNAVDARIPGSKLHIEVTVGQKNKRPYISVVDDGTGMSSDDLANAMVMGRSSKDGSTIGEFGFGLKTACSNLGAVFEIVTATADSDNAWRLTYDETKFIAGGRWEIEIEPADKPFDHGTQITIWEPKVHLYPGVKNAILEKFSKIFKHFIAANEVEILVNNTEVVPFVRDTIKEYDTEIAFEVNGKPVRGWASLATHGSGRGRYGLDLIRHNRVVVEHVKMGFKPGSTMTRLVGELHLNDFAVTNNKTDFRTDTDDWKQLNEQMWEVLGDLKRENRRLAHPGKFAPKDEAEVEEYIAEVKDALKSDDLQADLDRRALDADLADEFAEGPVPFDVPSDDATDEDGDDAGSDTAAGGGIVVDPRTDRTDTPSVRQQRHNRVKTQLRNIVIEHQLAHLGRESLYKVWEVEGVGAKKKLVVTTNQDHPMYTAMADSFMVWVKHNIVEAVAEFFTETTGRTEQMLLIKSDILKHIGKMTLEISEGNVSPGAEAAG